MIYEEGNTTSQASRTVISDSIITLNFEINFFVKELLHPAKTRNLHPKVRVDQAVRPLPPKTLSILVGFMLKLTSMCIMIYKVRKVWTVWFVLIMFLSNSLKECFSGICEKDEFVGNCVRNRKSNSL